jgi:hypothetical protein
MGNGLRVVNDEAWAYFYSIASPHGDIAPGKLFSLGSEPPPRRALRVILEPYIAKIDPKIAAFSS